MDKKIIIPPSKSISHRAIICGILSNSFNKIKNLGKNNDIDATIIGMKNIISDRTNKINCNESASTL
ncbi:MAG: hypothetical protein LBT02_03210, partial [Rickettsiales bacterium]|nr:hypothetical protein [Rickettsiales bacterium]